MQVLIIGGSGLISSACAQLWLESGHEVHLLNRGESTKYPKPPGATLLRADVRAPAAAQLLTGRHYDAVVDFIAFTPDDIERDLVLFRGKTDQFIFISSASAYQKPPARYLITESTPLENPFWQYSRDKIACEQRLARAHREEGFPFTIVRPSLTYGPSQIPLCVGSWSHPWTLIDRIRRGRPVIVPGDGTSLWVLTWNGDFARGLLGLLGNSAALGEAFHITSDEALSWDQIFIEAFAALGLQPKLAHIPSSLIAEYWPHARGSLLGDKMHSVVFNNDKIRRFVPDFAATVTWAQGLRLALAWHQAHPEFCTVDREFDVLLDRIIEAYGQALPPP